MEYLQKLVEFGGMFLIGNAILSALILIARLYMGVFGIEFDSFMVGPGLMINMLFSGAAGLGLYLWSQDEHTWQ